MAFFRRDATKNGMKFFTVTSILLGTSLLMYAKIWFRTRTDNSERSCNKFATDEEQTGEAFHKLVDDHVSPGDPRLVALVKAMIQPPSDNPVLKVPVNRLVRTPQATEVINLHRGKGPGVFVDCGAYDGETASNTIYLEQKLGWTGLLVEMDPFFYKQIRGKNRRAHSLNAGLSTQNRPTEMTYIESTGQLGKLFTNMTNLIESPGQALRTRHAPCVPFETMLLAMEFSHVDYFSLDVEGFELEVLKSLPFERLDISVLSVEYKHISEGKHALKTFMEDNGYVMYKDIEFTDAHKEIFVNDFVFVKNDFMVHN